MSRRRVVLPLFDRSALAGYRFPPEVILLAVRWYLRCGLAYRDVEELLSERGIEVDHVTIYRWVQRFTPWTAHSEPEEVVTDLAQALETVIEKLIPAAFHNTEQSANIRVECDHGRLKARLRPMRGLIRDRTASVVIQGHALIQNIRRGHYELGTEADAQLRLVEAFDELAHVI